MGKYEQYNIPLRSNQTDAQLYEFILDDDYFKKIDSSEVQHGKIGAKVKLQKKASLFELSFELKGEIIIPCDRCLDDMNQPIVCKDTLQVKLGEHFSEEGDIVIIPESEGSINVAWFLYEIIVLNIPLKHVHAVGECNKTMVSKLKKHVIHTKSDDDDNSDNLDLYDDDEENNTDSNEVTTDPRWDGLQNIFENN